MSCQEYMREVGRAAKSAAAEICRADVAQKNRALLAIGDAIMARRDTLLAENARDIENAKTAGLAEPMIDRLRFTDERIDGMLDGLRQVAALPDPVGVISDMAYRPNGLQVGKMRVPLGVVGIIFESRPNVTIDAASLCIKSGNASILRGGSEAIASNLALAACVGEGLAAADLPTEAVQVLRDTDRALIDALVTMDDVVDVIVPRGGKGLIERIAASATVPVIKHLDGICHVYIDDDADQAKAAEIAFNAKTQRYAVCNSMETLLVAESIAAEALPPLAARLVEHGVELRGCDATVRLLGNQCAKACEEDWVTEYLGPILSIRIVPGIDEAIAHINRYGSNHTDSIVTENYSHSRRFLREVDSSSVMINASPRFADGFEYGLGAEVGISTNKLHVRGPVGLEGLTSQKFVVFGDGQIRQ